MDALGETEREILLLKYTHEMKNAEIAEKLKLSANAVGLRHFRAMKKLAKDKGLNGKR